MKKILLVDDDAVILKIYQAGLIRRGFEVDTASDGLAAIRTLRANQPDVIVLDLMMPKLSGVDVLKFIRAEAGLAGVPVVVLSNVYLNELAEQAVGIGVERALLKTRCSPLVLADIINELLQGTDTQQAAPPAAPAASPATPPPAPNSSPPSDKPAPALAAFVESLQPPQKLSVTEPVNKARVDFLEHAPATCADIRALCKAFVSAPDQVSRAESFGDFYRKVRFLNATAGFAQFHHITLLASAFEALLFELREKPASLTPSVLRTLASTVDFLTELCNRARSLVTDLDFSARVLVVDDDPLSNRVVAAALLRAHLATKCVENPVSALQMLREKHYDLLLFDIEMPGMDGFEVCKRVRALPGYQKTPVIYITAHTDFEHRAKSVLSGGNDLIGKPVFPIELAAKAVTHLLRGQLSEPRMGS